MPFVSVVVPTHNRPEMLAETLASVRAQTFTDYEIIVVSNGEDPDTRARSKAAAVSSNARWLALDGGNVSAARNLGVEQAKGEWIAFLDDDDVWLPAKLERQVEAARRTGADLIACDFVRFFPDGREELARLRPPAGWSCTQAICQHKWGVYPSTAFIRRSVLLDVGGFDPGLRIWEDNDVWRRVSWRHTLHQMDEVLVRYRMGHASLTRTHWIDFHELRHSLKMYRDTPPDLRWVLPSKALLLRRWILRVVTPPWARQPRKYFRELMRQRI
jgi:glycosyltransferase involved in cell wall biosynthesis